MCSLTNSIMDQKSSASNFSLAELRDLFSLDEGTDCQTHDLLGCECGGRGRTGSLKAPDGPEGTEEEKAKVESDSESEMDSLPVDLLPGLMKASQVGMSKVEEVWFPPIFMWSELPAAENACCFLRYHPGKLPAGNLATVTATALIYMPLPYRNPPTCMHSLH